MSLNEVLWYSVATMSCRHFAGSSLLRHDSRITNAIVISMARSSYPTEYLLKERKSCICIGRCLYKAQSSCLLEIVETEASKLPRLH